GQRHEREHHLRAPDSRGERGLLRLRHLRGVRRWDRDGLHRAMSLLVLFQGPLSGAPPPSPAFHYAHPGTDVLARDRGVTAAEGLVAATLLAVDRTVPSTDTA